MPRKDPNPHLFLCNGAKLTSRAKMWRSLNPTELCTAPEGNVEIKIWEIARSLTANLSPVLADLLEIAASIYVADQTVRRIGRKTINYGDTWYRDLRFEVAVREPDFWNQANVKSALAETLGFLSGDTFEFGFSKHPDPPQFGDYLDFRATNPNPEGIQKVVMFSGGLDSLAGAVHEIFGEKRHIALVSHKPVGHIASRQKALFNDLRASLPDKTLEPLHVSVWAHKKGIRESDHTQRTRSFLYVTIGAVVAHLFGLDTVDFYENGVMSVNLPLAGHEFGARATRTTHPQTLVGFGNILSLATGQPFQVKNDFLGKTKQEVVELIASHGLSKLIGNSVSCMHTRQTSHQQPHCGMCSQCLSRRFATLGANTADDDASNLYREDVLTAMRKRTEDRIIAERFVGAAREIEAMESSAEFGQEYAFELSRITPYIAGRSSQVVDALFDLHSRHAEQVGDVVRAAMKEHVDAFHRGQLEPDSTIMMAFSQAATSGSRSGEASQPNSISFIPTKRELVVLEMLSDATNLMVQEDMVVRSKDYGMRIARKTLGAIITKLEELKYVEHPRGPKQGVAITDSGRALLNGHATQ